MHIHGLVDMQQHLGFIEQSMVTFSESLHSCQPGSDTSLHYLSFSLQLKQLIIINKSTVSLINEILSVLNSSTCL